MDESLPHEITFVVVKRQRDLPPHGIWLGVLLYDNWDDYGFKTSFHLSVFDGEGQLFDIGHVRIASASMSESLAVVLPKSPFTQLDASYFSLGAAPEYYANLNALPKRQRRAILRSLRDMAFDDEIWEAYRDEGATLTSLLRGKSANTVREQYRRVAHGGAVLTAFSLNFDVPTPILDSPFQITFKVDPKRNMPPTNVHALIGRNGSGKTFALRFIAETSVRRATSVSRKRPAIEPEEDSISGLICVSFSPFDRLHREIMTGPNLKSFPITRVSLHELAEDEHVHVKTPEELTSELIKSVAECAALNRYDRWQAAVRLLNTDPGFADYKIADINLMPGRRIKEKTLRKLFDALSSGHKIVLLTLTRLVERTAEKSLVLIDEPETHLHPPLLSSFIRAISEIMLDRNGVAIVATHSPVVLQEVPSACVWKLERFGDEIAANRPEIETFGENVGTLTREVFGFEVVKSGYHRLLKKAVEESDSFDDVLKRFRKQLGGEAQAIARGLMAQKYKTSNPDA